MKPTPASKPRERDIVVLDGHVQFLDPFSLKKSPGKGYVQCTHAAIMHVIKSYTCKSINQLFLQHLIQCNDLQTVLLPVTDTLCA